MTEAPAAATTTRNGRAAKASSGSLWTYIKRNRHYYYLLILPGIYFLIFRYGPIFGNILAFRRYRPGGSIYGDTWMGLTYFKQFLTDANFWNAFKNTWILSFLNISVTFVFPIVFALMVNELRMRKFKTVVQTVTYFPHFVSTVIVIGILKEVLSPSTGMVNMLLEQWGFQKQFFMNEPQYFRTIYIGSELWQHMGWNSIIYCAALSGIDPHLYEAAAVDGASKLRQVFQISIPMIASTIAVVLVIQLGSALQIGFEKILLMFTPTNMRTSDIIETFVYRMGLEKSAYSYATAVGLFGGLISCALVAFTNWLANKISGQALF